MAFEMDWLAIYIPTEVVGTIEVFRGIPLLVMVFHLAITYSLSIGLILEVFLPSRKGIPG